MAQSLFDVGFNSFYSLLGTYGGQPRELRPWLAGAEINRDGNLRLQYLAGMSLNLSMAAPIYNEILNLRGFPRDLFFGSQERLQRLRTSIMDQTGQ